MILNFSKIALIVFFNLIFSLPKATSQVGSVDHFERQWNKIIEHDDTIVTAYVNYNCFGKAIKLVPFEVKYCVDEKCNVFSIDTDGIIIKNTLIDFSVDSRVIIKEDLRYSSRLDREYEYLFDSKRKEVEIPKITSVKTKVNEDAIYLTNITRKDSCIFEETSRNNEVYDIYKLCSSGSLDSCLDYRRLIFQTNEYEKICISKISNSQRIDSVFSKGEFYELRQTSFEGNKHYKRLYDTRDKFISGFVVLDLCDNLLPDFELLNAEKKICPELSIRVSLKLSQIRELAEGNRHHEKCLDRILELLGQGNR